MTILRCAENQSSTGIHDSGGSEVTSDFIGPNDVKEADAVLQDFVLLKATLYVP